MAQVDKSVLVAYSAQQMYDLVRDVERYPEFLPWCGGASIVRESAEVVRATVEIRYLGVRQSFTTRNTHTPGERIDLTLIDGPFAELDGQWRFLALRDDACKVELQLRYRFSSSLLERLVGPVFHAIAESFIDSFARRARELYR
jgi:ribosome-associated toxin RatA of RatAB toxin-antitoxin module